MASLLPFLCDLVTAIIRTLPLIHAPKKTNRDVSFYRPRLEEYYHMGIPMPPHDKEEWGMDEDLPHFSLGEVMELLQSSRQDGEDADNFIRDRMVIIRALGSAIYDVALASENEQSVTDLQKRPASKEEKKHWAEIAEQWQAFLKILVEAYNEEGLAPKAVPRVIAEIAEPYERPFWNLFLQAASSEGNDALLDALLRGVVPILMENLPESRLQRIIQDFVDPILLDVGRVQEIRERTPFTKVVCGALGRALPADFLAASATAQTRRRRA